MEETKNNYTMFQLSQMHMVILAYIYLLMLHICTLLTYTLVYAYLYLHVHAVHAQDLFKGAINRMEVNAKYNYVIMQMFVVNSLHSHKVLMEQVLIVFSCT